MDDIKKKEGGKPLSKFSTFFQKITFFLKRTLFQKITLERILSTICYLAAAVFFFIAVFGQWRYLFTMALCLVIGIMISDDGKT